MLGRQNMSLADIIRVLPGFRFRPTDEELVCFYLRRKVSGRLLPFEVIADIDLYRYEPWELPEKSALPTRDLEWYYFIPRDRKYPNGSRTNRATVKGYWKSTGKDRCVSSSARDVGTKKTLVYYNGRAPKGERTNWVMHEYRLNKEECERIHAVENGFVLCRVYKKSGLGPKNGEQYGAPVEDEYGAPVEDDDVNDAPTGWVHECSAYKADIITGIPISADAFCEKGFSPQGEDDSVSFAVDMAGQQLSYSGNEPGQQQDHFEKFGCNYQQSSAQNNTRSVTGGFTTTENGELLEPPRTQEDEAEMLRKLLEECSDQLISADYHENNIVEDGFYETGGQFPSDGDYLELNDLSSATVIGEIEMVGEGDEKVAISGLKDYEGATENYSSQVLPVLDPVGEWKNLLLDAALSDGEQGMSQDMEMQSTFATVPHDLQQQPVMENILRDFAFPPAVDNMDTERAGSMQFILPDDDGLKFSNHQNTNDYEKDRAVLGSIANSELTFFQEGAYFDAETFFPDINECGESTNATLEGSNDDNTPHVAPSHSLWPNKFNNILDDGGMNAADNDGSAQVQAVSLEQGRRTSSSLDALFKWMNSLETSPALAAELSPKKASSGGPIHITATGIAMGTLSVTCTCIGEGVPSSCVSCSVTEVEKKAPFVRSVTLVGQVQKLLNKCNMGIFWGIFATLIWVLVGAGAWKAWGFVSSLVSWSKF